MAQHTIQVPMTADTYTSYDNPDISYGSSTALKAGGGELLDMSLNYKYHAYLKWDSSLPGLPPRKKLISVNLALYCINPDTWDRIHF